MNRKLAAIMIALFFLLGSCGSRPIGKNESSSEIIIQGEQYDALGMNSVDIPEIGFHAELQDITSEGAELILCNRSSEKQWYPQRYILLELRESKENRDLYEVLREVPHSSAAWDDVKYIVSPGQESSYNMHWSSMYGSLDISGLYMLELEYYNEDSKYTIGIIFSLSEMT